MFWQGGGEGVGGLRQLARRPGGELAVRLEPDHGVAGGVGPAHARVAVEQAMAIAVGGDHQQAAAEPGVAVAEALGEPGVPGGGAGGTMAQGGEHAHAGGQAQGGLGVRSEEHTSELQSLMRISYAVFCLKNKNEKVSA